MTSIHSLIHQVLGRWLAEPVVIAVYPYYFYDTSVIFSNSIITFREPFTICIGHDRRTDVIGIDCNRRSVVHILLETFSITYNFSFICQLYFHLAYIVW